ncbi:MAG: flavodoxin [Muribaculaceae bacterium]|nr:flavodoxin [Muribaculaceae bacterium]
MKKKISIIMAITVCATLLTACGNSSGQSGNTNAQDPSQSDSVIESMEADNEVTARTETQPAKVLVVYYSASGNTKAVAETIAEYTDGDIFEIIPVEEYSSEDLDWTKDGSRVNLEHEDEGLQDIALVSTTVEDFDAYDTVFIGYPIWWQEASWVVNNFVKDNDFTGKTVIPFCTSASSGLGESGVHLAKMAGTGDWQEGVRFGGSASESEVREWLDGLTL